MRGLALSQSPFPLIVIVGVLCRLFANPPLSFLTQSYTLYSALSVWFLSQLVGSSSIGKSSAGSQCGVAELEEEASHTIREEQRHGKEVGCGDPGASQSFR